MRRTASLTTVVALLALPPAAHAQDDGVSYDRDSPAGKEYALPLDRARSDAAPRGGGSGPSRDAGEAAPGAQPLFGAGVAPRSGGGAADGEGSSGTSGERKGSETGAGSTAEDGDGSTQAPAEEPRGEVRVASAEARASEQASVGGIAAAVLGVVALGAGLVLRRTRSRDGGT